MKKYHINHDDGGKRLDLVLAEKMNHSRNFIQNLIRQNKVRIDGELAKPSGTAKAGGILGVEEPGALKRPSKLELPVVYEDDDIIVIDKPAGIATHPPTEQSVEPTVVDFSRSRTSDPDPLRPGIVHRLDKDTSGLLIIAKNIPAKQYLQQLFASGNIRKTYLTLVAGRPRLPEAMIRLPIGRSQANPVLRSVNPMGKQAVTEYQTQHNYPKYTLLKVQPKTGRTHQIRVHLAHLRHPVVGDPLYGGQMPEGLSRLFLHAAELEFEGPSGRMHHFVSPLTPPLILFLNKL